jgi:YVTN family beta-propeller protein
MRAGLSDLGRGRRRLLGLCLVALVPVLASCAKPVGSASVQDVAWVATRASVTLPGQTVTPVQLGAHRVKAAVTVGSLPSALAYTPHDTGLLVVTQGDDTLHEIDPVTHDVVHTAGVGVEPDAVAVAPGGQGDKGIALVANLDSDTVTPVDLGTWRAGTPVPVGKEPVSVAVSVSASGVATAFVADFGANSVTPIDVATMTPRPAISVGPGPQTIAVAPGEVLVGTFGNHALTPINATTLAPGGAVSLPVNPTGIVVAPSGMTAYVCGGASVFSVSTLGLVVGTPVSLPGVAQGVALSADGTTAWVSERTGSIVPVTLASGTVGTPIHLGGHPSAIVIGPG